MKGFRKRKGEKEPTPDAHYAINLSRIDTDEKEKYLEDLNNRISKATADGFSVKSIINPLVCTGVIYGPFDTKRGAEMMPSSQLDEEGKDFFGTEWGFICTKMTENDFQRPLIESVRIFVCSKYPECEGVQRFKGACTKCKQNGIPLVKTIQIRDWEGKLK